MQNHRLKLSFLFFLFISIIANAFAQSERAIALKSKGIIIEEKILKSIEELDYDKILNFDFDEYRNLNSIKKIQINRGPILELESIDQVQNRNLKVANDIVSRKKDQNEKTLFHELITMVEIGFARNITNQAPETLR